MKILHVIEDAYGKPNTAGTIWLCLTLANDQCKDDDNKIGIVTNINESKLNGIVDSRINLYYTEISTRKVVGSLINRAVEIYKEEDYDLIHIHLAKLGAIRYIDRVTENDSSVKIIYTVHNLVNIGLPSHSVQPMAVNISNRDNVMIVGPSQYANNEWRSYVGIDDISNLTYVYNGIRSYDISHDKSYDEREYDVVFCGRLVGMKQTKQCLNFISNNRDLKVLYIGTVDDSPSKAAHQYTEECHTMMLNELEVNPNLTWMQNVDNDKVVELFSNSKVLITLGFETFGLSVAEAMSVGTMILSHNEGAVPELINDKVGKVVEFPKRSQWKSRYKLIRDSLDELLLNPKNPSEIYNEYVNRFTAPIMTKNYNILYNKFLRS